MSLPLEILKSRINNEISACERYLSHSINLPEKDFSEFPIDLEVDLKRMPALQLKDGRVKRRYEHSFSIIIDQNYPFKKPLVLWRTLIFHPNIMIPEDGGHVCIKLLDDWSFNSTLLSFIKGIESLLLSPNPSSPFGTDTCTAAAEYFNNSDRTRPPVICSTLPKVVREG